MADIQITLTIDDELLERVRRANDSGDIPDDLWEEAEDAVLDSVRSGFYPQALL